MTNHKKLIDVTASLERNCLYLEKKRYTKNRSVCRNAQYGSCMLQLIGSWLAEVVKMYSGDLDSFKLKAQLLLF